MTGQGVFDRKSALAFVLAFGVVSLFADAAYEGMRGVSGPFLALLGASGAIVGIVAGGGELIGYLLRLGSGRLAGKSGAYWPLAITGYVVQMAAVPALALAGSWQMAAALIVLERAGKAIRNPATNFMLSRAGNQIGQGWAFGLHEAMDQTGACAGPLIAALVLSHHGEYRTAFLWLGIPATLTILSVLATRLRFPRAGHVTHHDSIGETHSALPRAFWIYALAAALISFGFADYPLIAFHFARSGTVSATWIPIFYALAMAAAGLGSLLFGRWFDARGLIILVPAILMGAAVAPLAFLGGFWAALLGALFWGLSLGVHDAVMNAAIAGFVPEKGRAHAFGLFSAIYGIAWFAGSALLGLLYDHSLMALVVVATIAELAALIPLTLALKINR
ncbi:MAG: MFS transporter [Alphaproteobacteria bacterium]|nr:MFS transporter [Alphaproteobacteria bacterium]